MFRFEAGGLSGRAKNTNFKNENNNNGKSNLRTSNDSVSSRHSVSWDDEGRSQKYIDGDNKKSYHSNNKNFINDNNNKNNNKSTFLSKKSNGQTDTFENSKSNLNENSDFEPPGWEFAQEELMIKNDKNGPKDSVSEIQLSSYDNNNINSKSKNIVYNGIKSKQKIRENDSQENRRNGYHDDNTENEKNVLRSTHFDAKIIEISVESEDILKLKKKNKKIEKEYHEDKENEKKNYPTISISDSKSFINTELESPKKETLVNSMFHDLNPIKIPTTNIEEKNEKNVKIKLSELPFNSSNRIMLKRPAIEEIHLKNKSNEIFKKNEINNENELNDKNKNNIQYEKIRYNEKTEKTEKSERKNRNDTNDSEKINLDRNSSLLSDFNSFSKLNLQNNIHSRDENFDLTEISSKNIKKKENFVENYSNSGEYLNFVKSETQRNWDQIESRKGGRIKSSVHINENLDEIKNENENESSFDKRNKNTDDDFSDSNSEIHNKNKNNNNNDNNNNNNNCHNGNDNNNDNNDSSNNDDVTNNNIVYNINRNVDTINHKNIKVTPPVAFEKEALALQSELAQMQKALQDRMYRYQVLTAYNPDNATNSEKEKNRI